MELSQTINDELEQDNKMQEQQKIIQKLFQLIQQRKFEEALQLVDSLDTNDSLSILLNISLGLGANVEFLLALIDKGAELPSNTINILILKDNLKTIKVLINYGLSLNYLDPLGHSSIQNSVIHKRLSILKYLLESGLTPNELTLGLDALDVAIQNFVLSNDSIEYISLLLRYGSTVKNSHRQLLNEMSVKKPMEYKFLLNKHPNLFI
jgi:hypothetical protein